MSKGTTILAVKRGGQVAIAGDGQITVGDIVLKHTANKLRTLYHDEIIAGFAGAVADALTLFERFENQLEAHGGQLRRAAIELAEPRMDVLAVGKRPKVDATNPSLLAESTLRIQNSEQEPHLRPHDAAEAALAA